ncbi:hypothetical protein TrCOL_g22 [Triparma columacea]|jgi:hypothetical protein|uniref:Transmembrane protein n=1 Tax=Triparma columacea TaxID=722753 RepID=A0A9W7FXS8_9STRA|nr:hypothetical protein TrCOL_g22 [Triparma columacea]
MGGFSLEVFKFSLYLSIPVVATCIYASPSNMERIVAATRYVTFPPEERRPPKGEELEEEDIFKKVKMRRINIRDMERGKEKERNGEGKRGWFGIWGN